MQKSSKEFPWANIWMMLFAAAGIWLAWPRSEMRPDWYKAMTAIVPLAIVFLVGFLRMPVSLYYEGVGDRPTLNDIGRIYLDSVKQIFRHRWLLWFFGSVLAVRVLSGIAYNWLVYAQYGGQTGDPDGVLARLPVLSGGFDWVFRLARALPSAVSRSVGEFLPDIGLSGYGLAALLPGIGVIVLLFWLRGRLNTQSDDPQLSNRSQMTRRMLIWAALACIACLVLAIAAYVVVTRQQAVPDWRPNTAFLVVSMVASFIGILVHAVFSGALIAGLGGSLLRVKRGEEITAGSFRDDIVGYLVPVAGVYVVLFVVYEAMRLPVGISESIAIVRSGLDPSPASQIPGRVIHHVNDVLAILLMFAPFAAIVKGTGTLRAVKNGLRDWSSHASDAASFLAVGITVVSAVLLVGDLIPALLIPSGPRPYLEPPISVATISVLLQATLSVLVTATMMVAVWEFYWRITPHREPDAVVSPAHDPGI